MITDTLTWLGHTRIYRSYFSDTFSAVTLFKVNGSIKLCLVGCNRLGTIFVAILGATLFPIDVYSLTILVADPTFSLAPILRNFLSVGNLLLEVLLVIAIKIVHLRIWRLVQAEGF